MRHYGVTEGTQAEILAELDQYGRDRLQQGKKLKAEDIAEAWREVRDGATWVEVGEHHVYRVVEENDLGQPERDPQQAAIDGERDARVSATQDALGDD